MTASSIEARTDPGETVTFEAFGWSFGLQTLSEAARRRICGLYRDFATPFRGASSRTFVLQRGGVRNASAWQLTLDDEPILRNASLDATLDAMEFQICKSIVAARPDLMMIHGATVFGRERSALICGDSGAGKTTLSLALAARGYDVGSDDAALLDPVSQRVCALPRCFHLNSRSRRLLRRAGMSALGRRRNRFLTPADLGGGSPPAGSPHVVLVLEPGGERDRPCLTSMTQAEMTVRVLQHVAWGAFSGSDALRSLARLVSGASCYLLTRGRLDDTADVLGELLGATRGERSASA